MSRASYMCLLVWPLSIFWQATREIARCAQNKMYTQKQPRSNGAVFVFNGVYTDGLNFLGGYCARHRPHAADVIRHHVLGMVCGVLVLGAYRI